MDEPMIHRLSRRPGTKGELDLLTYLLTTTPSIYPYSVHVENGVKMKVVVEAKPN